MGACPPNLPLKSPLVIPNDQGRRVIKRVAGVGNQVDTTVQFLPREAMLSAVYAVVVCPCVCVCVCVSHSSIVSKRITHRITQIMSHDRPGTLVF